MVVTLVAHEDDAPRGLGLRHHLFAVLRRCHHRLLDQDMHASAEAAQDVRRVEGVRGEDFDAVQRDAVEHGVERVKGRRVGQGRVEGAQVGDAFRAGVGERGDGHVAHVE